MANAGVIRVASAQYPIDRLADLAAVQEKIARWVREVAEQGAELIVFPEYGAMEIAGTCGDAIAGNLAASLHAVSEALPAIDAHHAELAGRHGVHILASSGPSRRADGCFANAARLFSPSGRMGVQEKLIMTPFEHRWGISPGRDLNVFETDLGRIGVLICYDSEFPLLARAQAEAGARILLVPSCTERVSGYHRIRAAAMARALEGTMAVLTSPTVGEALWSPAVDRNAGAAGIFVPAEAGLSDTGVLAEGVLNSPQLVFADVDLSALARLKETGEMRNVADWSRQLGAAPLPAANIIDLRH